MSQLSRRFFFFFRMHPEGNIATVDVPWKLLLVLQTVLEETSCQIFQMIPLSLPGTTTHGV